MVIVHAALGYCWCENLGKNTTSREVSDIVRKLILKLRIPYTVRMEGGPEFQDPFHETPKRI